MKSDALRMHIGTGFVRSTLWVALLLYGGHFTIWAQFKPNPRTGNSAPAPAIKRPPPSPDPQPVRPSRQPVDLNDSPACLYELADIASLPLWMNTAAACRSLGLSGFPDEIKLRILDATVRLDHLMESPDPEFRLLVAEVRPMLVDVWRVYRGFDEFGLTHESEERLKPTWGQLVGYLVAMGVEEMLSPREARWREPNGTERVEVLRTDDTPLQQELNANLEARSEAADRERKERRENNGLLNAALGNVYCELAVWWERKLLPRLKSLPRPAGQPPLLSIQPAERIPRYGGTHFWADFGTTIIRSQGTQTLNHVVVEFKVVGNLGVRLNWYGYIPKLPPGNLAYFYPVGPGDTAFKKASVSAQGVASFYCAEGEQLDTKVSFKTAISESGKPTTIAQNTELHNKLVSARLRTAPAAARLLADLRGLYANPQNPATLRPILQSKLKIGRDYHGAFTTDAGEVSTVTIHVESIESPAAVPGRLTLATANGSRTFELLGRWEEEAERGCVLAFIDRLSPYESDAWAEIERNREAPRIHTVPQRGGGGGGNNPFLPSTEALATNLAQRQARGLQHGLEKTMERQRLWVSREYWVLTSPFEIAFFTPIIHRDDVSVYLTPGTPAYEQEIERRERRDQNTVPPLCVVYLDAKKQLWWQSQHSGPSRKCYFTPLSE